LYLGSGDKFQELASKIYPTELILNRENRLDTHATFLDLDITISNGRFHTRIFDKRDKFNFSIVNYPHSSSCMPKCIFRGVVISQILRFCRASSDLDAFISSVQMFVQKLANNGYSRFEIQSAISGIRADKLTELKKFNKPISYVVRTMIYPRAQ
jgi:hypothetical protein